MDKKDSVFKYSNAWSNSNTFIDCCKEAFIKLPGDLPKEEEPANLASLFYFAKKLPVTSKFIEQEFPYFGFLPNPELHNATEAWFREGWGKHHTKFTRTLLYALCVQERTALVLDILR
jgi:hypothetical protein